MPFPRGFSEENPLKTALVIPCYNEASRLDAPAFREFVASQTQVDLLFVNDGSTDGTMQVILSLRNARLQALNLAKNQGKAEAVRQGILTLLKNPEYDKVGFWDADLSTPLAESMRMLDYFSRDPQLKMIFGSRLLKIGNRIERLWIRHLLGRIFATLVSSMTRAAVYDTQCGAKMFRTEIARQLFAESFVSRWFFDVEILWRFRLNGYGLNEAFEMPVKEWVHKPGSKLKISDYLKTFWELFRIYRRYRNRQKSK